MNDNELVELIKKIEYSKKDLTESELNLLSNYDIAEKIVRNNAFLIEHLSEDLRGNINLVKIGFEQSSLIYKYVSDSLKDNEELLLFAIRQNPGNVTYASDRLKNDKQVLVRLLEKNIQVAYFIDLKDDIELWEILVLNNTLEEYRYRNAPIKIKNSKSIILKMIEKDPSNYLNIGGAFLRDKDVISLVLKNNNMMFRYLPEEEKENMKWIKILLNNDFNDISLVKNSVFLERNNVDEILDIYVNNRKSDDSVLNNKRSILLTKVLMNNEYKELFDNLFPKFNLKTLEDGQIHSLYHQMMKKDMEKELVQSSKVTKKIKF